MCAPMSPSAPEPAFSLSSRHDSGASGRRSSPAGTARARAGPCRSGRRRRACGPADRRHAAVGEADHGATPGGGGLRPPRPSPRPRRPSWPAASRTARACRPRAPRSRSRRACRPGCRCRPGRCRRGRPAPSSRSRRSAQPEPVAAAASTAASSRPATTAMSRPQRQVEEPGRGAPGLRVRDAHEGVADHADAEAWDASVTASSCGWRRAGPCGAGTRPARSGGSGLEGRSAGTGRRSPWSRRARSSWTVRGHLDLDQVAHRLALHEQAGQLDAVGAPASTGR